MKRIRLKTSPTTKVGKYLCKSFLGLLLFLISSGMSLADENSSRIGRIRAALVYNVIKFIDFENHPGKSLTLCLREQDPLLSFIESTVADKSINSRKIQIQILKDLAPTQNFSSCNVIVNGSSEKKPNSLAFLSESEKSPLTICSVEGVSWGECMIQIYDENNKARLAIDLGLIEDHSYKVSSELLEVSLVRK